MQPDDLRKYPRLRSLDQNGDGQVLIKDLPSLNDGPLGERIQNAFRFADRDGDNQLDAEEAKSLPGIYSRFKMFDKNLNGKIIFDNVSFKYEKAENNLINNFNFKINQGKKIAIIGNSGSGKSTIVKCLIGILSINKGNIYIDDIDYNTYDNKWLKEKIGYVAQDSILFSDTIANNIAYGIDNPQEKDIINAAIKANAHEFISKLPNKYQTLLEGTELSSLSGGQKQRISIARAIIRNPNILIFDEATSALDPECEELVQNTIKNCFDNKNITMIIIAHRRSALELADKIYRFENSVLKDVTDEIKNKKY